MRLQAYLLIVLSLSTIITKGQPGSKTKVKSLIVFFDGLRPDYITPENMPNLYAFSKTGVYARRHHSVFPTVTRVNASSYITGSYPSSSGIMGNTVFFPEIDSHNGLNTGNHDDLNKINAATNGHLLTVASLGEVLRREGADMMVFSSGSTGQAFIQNHTLNGAVIHPGLILPDSFKEKVINGIGPAPAEAEPNTAQHKWITDALIRYGLAEEGPLVNVIWFSDPDGTAHSEGIGAGASMESIKIVDEQFGRILESLKSANRLSYTNIIISADHGFVTHTGTVGLTDFLVNNGLKKSKDSEEVVVAGQAIYVKDHDSAAIGKIVGALMSQDWVGPIFTKGRNPGDTKGFVPGTLSFESIHWNHARAGDILVCENWDDRKNEHGYAGAGFSTGVAGHGGLSPYEVHIPLLVSGPDFKAKVETDLPTSNIDIVPTLLSVHGIAIPETMTGRVLGELLNKDKPGKKVKATAETITTNAKFQGGTYTVTLQRTVLDKARYIDYAKVVRVMD